MGFRLQCPGYHSSHAYKLVIFNNGTAHKNIQYLDICEEQISYSRFAVPSLSDLSKSIINDTLIYDTSQPYHHHHSMYPYALVISIWELIKPLLDRHNITPQWTKFEGWDAGIKENGTYNGVLGQLVDNNLAVILQGCSFLELSTNFARISQCPENSPTKAFSLLKPSIVT